jgi:hypothetical protein
MLPHWCAEESMALMSFLGALPFAWRWLKTRSGNLWRRLRGIHPAPHEITSDGKTVWINGPDGLLGRFGPHGIDIHRPLRDQSEHGECLHCTHVKTSPADWDIFCAKMQEHFGIQVPPSYLPERFRG